MNSTKPDRDHEDFRDLDRQQVRFLRWIGSLIPALLKAVARGAVESRWILGRRRLKDGRNVELSLMARAPDKEAGGGYTAGGAGNTETQPVDSESLQTVRLRRPRLLSDIAPRADVDNLELVGQ